MASVQTYSYDGRYLKLTVIEESYSIEKNTSTIRWTLESIGGSVNCYSIYNWGVWVNDQEIYPQQSTNWDSYSFPATTGSRSGTLIIGHNTDGTASPVKFTLKGCVFYGNVNQFDGQCPLTIIPRTSQMSMSTTDVITNSKVTLNTNRKSDSFTHTFTYSFGDITEDIATNVTDSIEWLVPRSLANQIPNAVKGTGTIYCKTYNGNTYIGQSSSTFTVNIDDGLIPSITSSGVSDGNPIVANKKWGTLLKNLSWLKAALTGTGIYNSTITTYNCQYEGITYSDNTLNGLNNQLRQKSLIIGNRTCKLWVTDSRGRESDKVSKTYNVTDYFSPSISKYDAQRCDVNGNITDDGTYLKIEFVGSAAPVNNKNTFTARVGYKLKTESSYGNYINYVNASTTEHSINKTGDTMIIFGDGKLSSESSYDIIFEISDIFNLNQRYKEVSTGFDLIHFNTSGKSIAFGKKSEASDDESKVEFGMDTDFKKAIYLNGVKLFWYE